MIWGQYDDFEIWRDYGRVRLCQNLLRTAPRRAFCALFVEIAPQSPVWRWFEASTTILRSSGRQTWDFVKTCSARSRNVRFVPFLYKSHCLHRFGDDLRPVRRFWDLLYGRGEIVPKLAPHGPKRAFCALFVGNRTVFPIWRWFEASTTILRCSGRQKWDFVKTCSPRP